MPPTSSTSRLITTEDANNFVYEQLFAFYMRFDPSTLSLLSAADPWTFLGFALFLMKEDQDVLEEYTKAGIVKTLLVIILKFAASRATLGPEFEEGVVRRIPQIYTPHSTPLIRLARFVRLGSMLGPGFPLLRIDSGRRRNSGSERCPLCHK